jgi:hypothetical protein
MNKMKEKNPYEIFGIIFLLMGLLGGFVSACVEPNLISVILSIGLLISGSILVKNECSG